MRTNIQEFVDRVRIMRSGSTAVDDTNTPPPRTSRARRRYNRIMRSPSTLSNHGSGGDDQDRVDPLHIQASDSALQLPLPTSTSTATGTAATSSSSSSTQELISITILDSAHNKFQITIESDATVLQLKRKGEHIHSISSAQQRLISMGPQQVLSSHLRWT